MLLLALGSCKKDSNLPDEDLGHSFFPYTPGDYRIYNVDSTYYDDFLDSVKHFEFQLKEVFESWFYDAQNRKCLRIERWVKLNDSTDWYLRDVWYSCMTDFRAEKVEENVRFIRLAFPVRSSTKWDINAFNENVQQICEYENIDEFYSNGILSFDSTVTVLQEQSSNLIEEKNQYEIYARGVGLVFKKFMDVEKEFVTGNIVAGTDFTYILSEYGHN